MLGIWAAQSRPQGFEAVILPDDLRHLLGASPFRQGFCEGYSLQAVELLELLAAFPIYGRPAGLLLAPEIPEIQPDDDGEKQVDQP